MKSRHDLLLPWAVFALIEGISDFHIKEVTTLNGRVQQLETDLAVQTGIVNALGSAGKNITGRV